MKKIVLPSLLAAIVVFIWMFISWAVLPWHNTDMKNIRDDALVQQMKSSLNEPGIYLYPGEPADESDAGMGEWFSKFRTGPVISFMVYYPNGIEPMNPLQFIKGFVINFIAAFIAGILLMMTLAQNPSFWRKVIFIMLLGLFAGFIGPFIEWNWWNFPTTYTIVGVVDYCVTWFFAGLILAWRIKP